MCTLKELYAKHLLHQASDAIDKLQAELIREQHRKSRIRSGGYRRKHNLASSIGRDNELAK